MKIAIIGAKTIGSTLGRKWAQAQHQLMFGVRDTSKPETQALATELNAKLGTAAQAIEFGEVVVFAIPGKAMAQTIEQNAAALAGKTIIDTANNMGASTLNSAAEFAKHVPSAKVYRAFNSLGWENFANPMLGGLQADLFYCGAPQDRANVEQLISHVGLRPVYVGGLEQVALVDMLGGLWFAMALGQGHGRRLAFKMITD